MRRGHLAWVSKCQRSEVSIPTVDKPTESKVSPYPQLIDDKSINSRD